MTKNVSAYEILNFIALLKVKYKIFSFLINDIKKHK